MTLLLLSAYTNTFKLKENCKSHVLFTFDASLVKKKKNTHSVLQNMSLSNVIGGTKMKDAALNSGLR